MQPEMRQMIESILRELVHTLRPEPMRPPKVLYIFCDSTAHEAYTDHFIRLKQAGVCHDILFLDGESSSWWGKHRIECGGAGKMIAVDEYAPAPLEVPMEYDGIVIPELDLDNAARAARGLKGTVKSEIMFSALVLGKYVLVGDDAPGLKRADRRTLKTLELTEPYKLLMGQYKKELAALGVQFAPQRQLADAVADHFAGVASRQHGEAAAEVLAGRERVSLEETVVSRGNASFFPGSALDSGEVFMDGKQSSTEAASVSYDGKLVSAAWVQQQWRGGQAVDGAGVPRQLVIGQGTIISPLARDALRQSGVTIQYKQPNEG